MRYAYYTETSAVKLMSKLVDEKELQDSSFRLGCWIALEIIQRLEQTTDTINDEYYIIAHDDGFTEEIGLPSLLRTVTRHSRDKDARPMRVFQLSSERDGDTEENWYSARLVYETE